MSIEEVKTELKEIELKLNAFMWQEEAYKARIQIVQLQRGILETHKQSFELFLSTEEKKEDDKPK